MRHPQEPDRQITSPVEQAFILRAGWRFLPCTLLSSLLLSGCHPAAGETNRMNPLRQLSLEELMDIEGTSGSKKEQKLNEASAAFEAITIARRIVIVVSLKTPDDSDGLQALTNPSFRSAPEVPRSELGVIETLGHGGVRPPGELVDAPGP